MRTLKQGLCAPMLAALTLALPGCGSSNPETFPVSGTVTLDGRPVSGAAVVFTPDTGQPATGTTDNAGQFELSTFQLGDGALPGKHRVTIAKTTVDPNDRDKVLFLIPQKYGNRQTSELMCDVQAKMAPVRFDLQSEAKTVPQDTPPPAISDESSESEQSPATAPSGE